MAVLTSSARDDLPDSAFAYIEPGGKKVNGKTVPGRLRHFPIHDAAHVRNALARIAQGARFGAEAKPKVLAAAKKFGIDVDTDSDSSSTGRSLESLYPEVRFLSDVPEIRSATDDGPAHITGYAAAFGKLSRRLGGFVERVMPTAFDEARNNGWPDVVCRYNHKDDLVLGTTASGTLHLETDERGLRYDVVPPSHRSDVLELVQRGDVRYSSFAFRCMNPGTDDEWGVTEFNFPMRSLHTVALLDVAPVLDPAYRDTSAVARSMTGAVESLAMWVEAEPAEVRSMLEAGQASRFFKRTDRSSASAAAAVRPTQREHNGVLDDPAVALRPYTYVGSMEDRASMERHVEETRVLHDQNSLCMRYVNGEPCVLAAGHDGAHMGRCWGTVDGLPCALVADHGGEHLPMQVDDGEPPRGPGRPRTRDGLEAAQGVEARTLSGPEALVAAMAMRAQMTPID